MQPLRAFAVACALALVTAGCGDDKAALSPGCTQSAGVIETALRTAPAAVALPDGTALSRCIADGTGEADLENVGQALLTAAEHLGERARGGDRDAAVQLGYLIGATIRGAARTNGVMAQLQRRIELVGSRLVDRMPAVAAAVAAGQAAGEARG